MEACQAKDTKEEEVLRQGTESVAAKTLHELQSMTGLGLIHSLRAQGRQQIHAAGRGRRKKHGQAIRKQ